MIVIDASAMIAMLFGEPHSTCRKGRATCGTSARGVHTSARPRFLRPEHCPAALPASSIDHLRASSFSTPVHVDKSATASGRRQKRRIIPVYGKSSHASLDKVPCKAFRKRQRKFAR